MRILGYIISFLFFIPTTEIAAQEYEKPKRDWTPSLVFLSADVVGLARMISSDDTRAEFSVKTDFDQFFLAFDFGVENKQLSRDSKFEYSSEGRFFRIGPQINFMKFDQSRSNLFFGAMYGSATLSDRINYAVPGGAWGPNELELANTSFGAQWLEANLGMSVRIAGPLFIGYTIRFKLFQSTDAPNVLNPYSIPGYGPSDKPNNFGFNYYLTYRFGFRKKWIPSKPSNNKKRLEKVPVNETKME